MNDQPTYLQLLQNISLLLALILIFDLLRLKVQGTNIKAKLLVIGFLIGGMGILIMLTPWVITPGIVFDTRSVLLSISGLFFGIIPTLVAMAMTILLRIYQGGGGALTGTLVILATGSLGILWRYFLNEPIERIRWWKLYIFGILTHLLMLALMFTLPKENISSVLQSITLPVIIIYPLGTMLLGLVLKNRLRQFRTQEELVNVTGLLITTQELSKIGGWEVDVASRTSYWSEEMYRIHDFSPDDFKLDANELFSKSMLCYPPAEREVVRQAFTQCIDTGQPYDLELKFVSTSGESKWVRTKAEPVIKKGKVEKVFGTLMDITERKKSEDQIIKVNSEFKSLIENTPIGIVIFEDNGTNYFINRTFTEITGYTIEDIPTIEEWCVFAFPDETFQHKVREVWEKEIMNSQPTESPISPIETRIRKKDGSDCYLEIGFVFNADRNIATFIDRTKSREAEQKLIESEDRYRNLLESAPVGIVVISNLQIEYVNPAGMKLVGSNEPNQILGRPVADFIHPSMLLPTLKNIEKLLANTISTIQFENIFLKLDGTSIIVETVGTNIQFQGKSAIQVIVSDISDRKALEKERKQDQETLKNLLADAERSRKALLSVVEDQKFAEEEIRKLNKDLELRVKQRTAQLEASNKELEAFAYSVSHDLRAPLRGIHGFSHILEKEYGDKLDEEGKRLLGVIRKNSEKMDQLIVDLLALSRANRAEINLILLDMKSMVRSVYQELATADEKVKFQFVVDDLPGVYADPILMKQVWVNLISNAIKFTTPKEECTIEIHGFEDEEFVTYCVQDNGVGFDPKKAEKMFKLFERFHNERDFAGTGVGLSIVQRIITRHLGWVWASSEVGKGSEFYFSIPKNLSQIS